ncbi:UNVERIFIED_CONTAM: hypothetical protein RKD50_004530 [Streptomyces canus]
MIVLNRCVERCREDFWPTAGDAKASADRSGGYHRSCGLSGVSPFSRAPRTVLAELVPGVLAPGAATRILCAVRVREAGSLTTWQVGTAKGAGETQNHPLVEPGPRTLTPHLVFQVARPRWPQQLRGAASP